MFAHPGFVSPSFTINLSRRPDCRVNTFCGSVLGTAKILLLRLVLH